MQCTLFNDHHSFVGYTVDTKLCETLWFGYAMTANVCAPFAFHCSKKIIKTQLAAEKRQTSTRVLPASDTLLKKTPFTRLVVRSEETECWLATIILFNINEQLAVDGCTLRTNYILAADEKELKQFIKMPICSRLFSRQWKNTSAFKHQDLLAARDHKVPGFEQALVMVATDLTGHGKLGLNRHVYSIVFWGSYNDLLNILFTDPLNVTKSLYDFGQLRSVCDSYSSVCLSPSPSSFAVVRGPDPGNKLWVNRTHEFHHWSLNLEDLE